MPNFSQTCLLSPICVSQTNIFWLISPRRLYPQLLPIRTELNRALLIRAKDDEAVLSVAFQYLRRGMAVIIVSAYGDDHNLRIDGFQKRIAGGGFAAVVRAFEHGCGQGSMARKPNCAPPALQYPRSVKN